MTRLQEFAEDCVELAVERYNKGQINRRTLIQALTALGAVGLSSGLGSASAAAKEVVMATWGGDSQKAFVAVFGPLYEKAGGKFVYDESGPSNGKIKAMVDAKNVTWDVCDAGVGAIGELGPRGLLEKIDYSVVDKSKVPAEFAYEYGICNYMSSFVLAWNKKQVSAEPTLADFFDVKKYPGKRALRKSSTAMLEMALMADGVPADKLYPLDQARAFKKIASIKDDLIFWDTGSRSMDILRNGDVAMAYIWNTRANVLKREPNSEVDYTFKGGFLMPACWVVPKGNPAGKLAMEAIAVMQDPKAQIALLDLLGNGPANPAARALETPEQLAIDNGSPANAAVQAKTSAEWYRDYFADSEKAYVDLITSFS